LKSTCLLSTIAIIAVVTTAVAMAQNDSPCNQGRDPQRDPRNPYAICLPEIGRMDAFLPPCHITGYGEQFGNQLATVGDVDHSGTVDFVVGHQLCSYKGFRFAEELLLYKGVKGGLPASTSGQRIGPTDTNSRIRFLAAGDWDNDGNVDIAVRIQILDDTTAGNHGYEISRLVVFWGNESGDYSLADTTRLESGAQMWLSIFRGLGSDIDQDGTDDLLVGQLSGFTEGSVVKLPQMMIFKGHSKNRWGQDGIGRTADWVYWKPQPEEYTALTFIDQDQDGVKDIVFARNESSALGGSLSVLYCVDGKLPDTADIQTISFVPSKGRFSLFSDVTGDKIPDLLIGSGRDDFVKVYVGFKGQRLLEQYGGGNDSAQPGNDKWWGKPWATIWLPRKINPNWFGDSDNLFDLGDVNLDGIDDIFAFSWPYVVAYNGGDKLDSMADALINITPGTELGILKRLGDIDGSGRDIIALTTGNEIRFYAPTKSISSLGIPRRLPPGTGTSSVEEHPIVGNDYTLALTAMPNPSRGEIQFSWHGSLLRGSATITIFDLVGKEVAQCDARAEDGKAECHAQNLASGTYVAQIRCGDRTAATTILIR
jgi:Secretion system C-terminal sorting domain